MARHRWTPLVGVLVGGAALLLVPRLGLGSSALLFLVFPVGMLAVGSALAARAGASRIGDDEPRAEGEFRAVEDELRRLFRSMPGGDHDRE